MTNEFWNQTTAMGNTPAPDAYKQLAKAQHVPRGSTQAVALPQSLPGFMVGRSTLEGAPIGWNGRGEGMRINVDPDVPGEGFSVDMTVVTSDAFQQAIASAQVRQSVSIDELRDRASAIYRSFANGPADAPPSRGENVNEYAPDASSTPQQAPPQPYHPPQPSPQGPPPQWLNPVSGPFNKAAFAHSAPASASLFDQLDPPRVVPKPARTVRVAGSAPTYRVTFEVKDSPAVIETWYHEIVRNAHVLVLVYDTSCTGYPRARLQPTDSDIAVHIEGSDSIYLVQDPSITFDFGAQEFQVLLIKAEHPFGGSATTE